MALEALKRLFNRADVRKADKPENPVPFALKTIYSPAELTAQYRRVLGGQLQDAEEEMDRLMVRWEKLNAAANGLRAAIAAHESKE